MNTIAAATSDRSGNICISVWEAHEKGRAQPSEKSACFGLGGHLRHVSAIGNDNRHHCLLVPKCRDGESMPIMASELALRKISR